MSWRLNTLIGVQAVLLGAGCTDPWSRGTAEAQRLGEAGRAHLRRGQGPEAISALTAAAERWAARGEGARAVRDFHAAAFAALRLELTPHRARRLLLRAQPWLPAGDELTALHPYYEGLTAALSAQHVEAIRRFRRARAELLRLGRLERAAEMDEVLASSLLRVGRWVEADAVLDRLRAHPVRGACSDARRLSNLGWLELQRAEAEGASGSVSALRTVERARAIHAEAECGAIPAAMNHNLAYARLAVGDVQGTLRALARDHAAPQGEEQWFRTELEARLAEAQQQIDLALQRLGVGLSDKAAPLDVRHRLLILRARIHARRGDGIAARRDFAAADGLLDDLVHRVPLGEGRAALTHAQVAPLAEWLALLLEAGRVDAAECAARRARARTLAAAARSVQLGELDEGAQAAWDQAIGAFRGHRRAEQALASQTWSVPADELDAHRARLTDHAESARDALEQAFEVLEVRREPLDCEDLPSPRAGELFLTFAPLPEGGVSFARTAGALEARQHKGPKPFKAWPRKWGERLSRAKRVRLVAVGGRADALHAEAWRGKPLLFQRPVIFGLDLPSKARRLDRSGRVALLVSDPKENLPGARREARSVRPRLDALGYEVRVLQGRAAQLDVVHGALEGATHFHYAGHADDSRLAPAHDGLQLDGGTLSPGDVLALEHVPETVVLMGCRTLAESRGAVLGVAQAFLLNGAQTVIASGEDVDDELAESLSRAVYATKGQTLERAFSLAAQTLEARGQDGWRAFQVWGR